MGLFKACGRFLSSVSQTGVCRFEEKLRINSIKKLFKFKSFIKKKNPTKIHIFCLFLFEIFSSFACGY